MVEAPLADAAVVRAFAMVPDEMFEALIALIPEPSPLNKDAVITLEPKFPEASRNTKVDALLAVLPVVRALSNVPELMFEALMLVTVAALPEILVNDPVVAVTLVELTSVAVIVLAVNEPVESRRTMVLAPFEAEAVVLALSKVPNVIAEALMGASAAAVSCP
jgi:hypothetical protein